MMIDDDGRIFYLVGHNTVSTEKVGAVEAPRKMRIIFVRKFHHFYFNDHLATALDSRDLQPVQ